MLFAFVLSRKSDLCLKGGRRTFVLSFSLGLNLRPPSTIMRIILND